MKGIIVLFSVFLLAVWVPSERGIQIQDTEKKTLDSVREEVAKTNYQEVRIRKMPIALQCWTFREFSFFETLDKARELGIQYLQPYPGQMLSRENPDEKFNHKLDDETLEEVKRKLEEYGLELVAFGVVDFENTEGSMRPVFDFAKKMGILTIVTEPEFEDFSLLVQMAKEYNMNIAIHNHPEPSKYYHPETVYQYVAEKDVRIGACADNGHWMRAGIKPVEALRLLERRIKDVHLKDRNMYGMDGAFDVPFGQGAANIHDILAELTLQDFRGFLSIEHENPDDVDNPLPPVREGIEYIKSITYYEDYEELLKWQNGRYSKHGWNHYGPGYFVLDEKTGILKGQGGMGLFWYSAKKYEDFILELDYRCEDDNTNSGIFLRIPEVPACDDYINHSFEIQINDSGKGIHKTAAIYDAEPPMMDAFKQSGEWNHFKLTFKGKHITVELNGQKVVDWEAEPRGKVKDFSQEGYIGLQNHDSRSPIYYRNIFIKELR